MPPATLLDRILWTQLARVVHGAPPEWEPQAESARAIRGVLEDVELDPEESGIVERWDEGREGSRRLFDRLLQARVNRAVREGLRVEAERLGLAELPRVPRVLVVREGAPEEERGATVQPRRAAGEGGGAGPSPKKTIIEFLSSGRTDVANLAPGAKLDELVDLLVLANQGAAEELRETMGPSASVVRADDEPEIDLLLAGPTPSIQVFDIERELARLEEVLRNAIPPEKRPAKSGGTWSFGQDLTNELLGGKYRIKALKGKGAFKTVYEGEDEMLGARVAVAVLNPRGARSPRALEHFQDEARKLTTLDHENIVRWITFDRTSDGLHYFVMEYLDGEELEKVLRREQRLAPRRVAQILSQVVAALKRAHKGGKQGSLLHLDLKPENVFVLPALAPGEPERVKVIDFGIGQHVGAEIRAAERPELRSLYDLPAEDLDKSIGSIGLAEEEEEREEREEKGTEEEEGAKKKKEGGGVRRRVERARGGTLLYASPEQCKHLAGHKDIEELDGRSDLYSLGVMAFRMLTGQYPFARNSTAFEAIQNHLETPPRKVGSLGIKVPRELAAFVDRCLVKDRAKRWKDAGEAYEALERIVHPRRSPVKVAVPVAGLVLAGLGVLYFTRDPVVNSLTLVDPANENVSERVLTALAFGPESPVKTAGLEPESGWRSGAPLRLVDTAGGGGETLAGWSVRWAEGSASTIEIASGEGARTVAAKLEIDGGRRERWRSERLTLRYLGPWRIEELRVPGHDPEKLLDPRGFALEIAAGGDAEGREALASIEVLHGETSIGRAIDPTSSARGALAVYPGPSLDALFTGAAREVELRVVARDRAGQEEERSTVLRLAGEPAEIAAGTGFVAEPAPGAALLQHASEVVILPKNALRIAATAPARARVFRDSDPEPKYRGTLREAEEALVVTLEELGIGGEQDLPGSLTVEIDDSTLVDRKPAVPHRKTFAFRFTPKELEIQALLRAEGVTPRDLVEHRAGAAPNAVAIGKSAQLVVRPPPGLSLWIEAACSRTEDGGANGTRMKGTAGGAFELDVDFPEDGTYRLAVQSYYPAGGGERGPAIPPGRVYLVEIDRTRPEVTLELAGADGESSDGVPLFRGSSAQRVLANVTESGGLEELVWSLLLPDETSRTGRLEPAASVELRELDAHQSADGPYELVCRARDRAGNWGEHTVAWQVARTGPELTLEVPGRGTDRRWILRDGRGWNVQVRARDPNGVESVRARVVYDGQPGPELALVRAAGDLWELAEADRPNAYFWWTGKKLVLELAARDGAGNEKRSTEEGLVPDLPPPADFSIAPRERQAEAMLRITVGGTYVFGGRKGEDSPKWNVEVKDLRSFYLDAREVTRGEFLEFLRAPGGYMELAHWPAGSAPEAQRAADLAGRLGGDSERPATGIRWPEAYAYAAWRGKRLPTLVEWEFAVRGAEYRPRPPARLESLCAGAREWTATPERLAAEALDFPTQCKRYPDRLLATGAGAGTVSALEAVARATGHWVVGPGPGAAADWTAKETVPDAEGPEDVGFRCALDLELAHSRLDRGEYVSLQ